MVNAPEGLNQVGDSAWGFGTAATAPTCLKEQGGKIQNKSEKSMMKIERPDWAGTKRTNSKKAC